MKKLVTFLFLVLNVLSFSDTFNDNEDERTILKQEQRVEQERLQKEFQKREEDFNKLKLEKYMLLLFSCSSSYTIYIKFC